MSWDQIEGNWNQFRQDIREKWGKLTDDDLNVIDSKRENLIEKIKERYGLGRQEAENQVDEWESTQYLFLVSFIFEPDFDFPRFS